MLGFGNIFANAINPNLKLVTVAITMTTTFDIISISLGLLIKGLIYLIKTTIYAIFNR